MSDEHKIREEKYSKKKQASYIAFVESKGLNPKRIRGQLRTFMMNEFIKLWTHEED